MRDTVMEILCEICGAGPGELEAGLDLFEAGLLDSFSVVQLLVELEARAGVSLDIEKLRREEIATPELIVRLAEGSV